MISLPEGFSHSELVSAFGTLGAYIVGAYVIILAGNIAFKALRGGSGA